MIAESNNRSDKAHVSPMQHEEVIAEAFELVEAVGADQKRGILAMVRMEQGDGCFNYLYVHGFEGFVGHEQPKPVQQRQQEGSWRRMLYE